MFDLGAMELLVIGVVALIVVGPEDLPRMFRAAGRFTGKMKGMAREFTKAMSDAADETGMRETARDLKSMTSARKLGLDGISEAAKSIVEEAPPHGPETEAMTERRRRQVEAIRERSAEAAQARLDREAEMAAENAPEPEVVADVVAEPKASGQ
ncbi:sec-independent protein translocase protein TatB [Hasllibacter halocynthiae]|uniref:Sec-independent protein translocase protein TatB n=1 Tax=Hasllibacter halocynthiae TaxID=595589 RepID=A0A2T0X824_9RHOB|nr:Sec-independent protein translocase protein TatB [Hasllibacter halocynthiae]PRY95077.1 sec-independent protein translocase protein TatB [Hasllibacter halocynthiae]